MKRKTNVLTLVAVLLSIVLCSTIAANAIEMELEVTDYTNKFQDIQSDSWYIDALNTSVTLGLMQGTSNETFNPNDNITRQEFVMVLYRVDDKINLEKQKNDTVTTNFIDVDVSAWYANAVLWAEHNNITTGISDDKFGVNQSITREEVATLLIRYLENHPYFAIKIDSTDEGEFADIDSVSTWAKDSVEKSRSNGIFIGNQNGEFNPSEFITRAEVAQVMSRFYLNLDCNFNTVFNAENIGKIMFTAVELTLSGVEEKSYEISDNDELSSSIEYFSSLKPNEVTKDFTMETTGVYYLILTVFDKEGKEIIKFKIANTNTLIISGFKAYIFEENCFEDYISRLDAK